MRCLPVFLTLLSAVSLSGCKTTFPGQAKADSTKLVVQPERIDQSPIEIRLEAPTLTGAERQGSAWIVLSSRVQTASLGLSLGLAGGVELVDPPPEFRRVDRKSPPVAGGIPFRVHYDAELAAMRVGEERAVPLTLRFGEGYGYVAVGVHSPAREEPLALSESFVLYFLARDEKISFSSHSILDLDVRELRERLQREGVSPEQIDKAIQRKKRGGATVERRVGSPDPERNQSITVEGRILYTDFANNTHPVRFATVEIWDEEAAADDLVTTTTTDANGDYSVSVDDNDGDGTGRDVYVVAYAQGSTVSVEDFDNPGVVWAIDSLPAVANVPDFTTVTLDLTAGNDIANPNQVAFEVYEACNTASRYLTVLGESLPSLCTISYPRPSDGSYYTPSTTTVTMGGTDAHDWDNMQHEYGHHVQNEFNIADSPGGAHQLGQNLCNVHGKDDGLRLAWGEAWPTFFSVMLQAELGLGAIGIPNVGDTSYTDTKPVGADLTYDLEPSTVYQGESDEVVNQRILWDLYDSVDDDDDIGVSLSALVLWDLVEDNLTHTLSEFWNALFFGHTEAEKASFGEIAEDHGVGTSLTAPADGATYAGGAAPTFQWNPNLECDTGANGRFSVRYYTPGYTSLVFASPWQSPTSLIPSDPQRDLIFVGPDAGLPWLVASRDITVPETGPYYGDSGTINDNFDVPDRGPVDIILALDVSSSMNSAVPGGSFGLTKIELLRQAVEIFLRTWSIHAIDGDRIGVVYFSTDTSSVPGTPPILMDMTSSAVVDDIISDVNGTAGSGCTALGGAVQVAFNSFSGTNRRVIIVFSDGMQSTNPFVGEEGNPARLKIKDFASGSTLPFDAFFCDPGTANAPDGATIVPDGMLLDDHSVQIHTIGVGVDGVGFEDLIERIADETSALYHFTSAPDENLDIFYTNDLVSSLKTASLEVVRTDSGTLGSRGMKTLGVPVNQTAISLTLVLSWKGELRSRALGMVVTASNGSSPVPIEVREGNFFRIEKYDLDDVGDGNWSVALNSATDVSLKYQFSAILDEPCFHYDFSFPRLDYGTGDSILVTASVTESGRPVLDKADVWLEVTMPTHPIGKLLADWLPRIEAGRFRLGDVEKGRIEFESRVAAAYRNPEFARLARSRKRQAIQLFDSGSRKHGDAVARDGIYSNRLMATRIPGNYELLLRIMAATDCGRIMRQELNSTLVRIAKFDPNKSRITILPLGRSTYSLLVAPADRFGNVLGPGHGDDVEVFVKGGELEQRVRDRFDGCYEQKVRVRDGHDPMITVQVEGQQLFHARFSDLLRDGKRRLAKNMNVRILERP
ncbi:MAG: vWA domain-containing protein [Planctomycetota bacterium]|jgi:hypothetical protein